MPLPRDRPVTVGQLVEQEADIGVFCDVCGRGRKANLKRILEAAGPDCPMLDRLPLCTTPGCLGVRRFRDRAHAVQGFLLSERGQVVFRQHHEWLQRTRLLIRRRDIVVAKVLDLPKPD